MWFLKSTTNSHFVLSQWNFHPSSKTLIERPDEESLLLTTTMYLHGSSVKHMFSLFLFVLFLKNVFFVLFCSNYDIIEIIMLGFCQTNIKLNYVFVLYFFFKASKRIVCAVFFSSGVCFVFKEELGGIEGNLRKEIFRFRSKYSCGKNFHLCRLKENRN